MSRPPFPPIDAAAASPEVRAVFDEIKAARQVDEVNNFWKYLANDPVGLRRTWESLKEVMGPGRIDPLTKQLIYLAVSLNNDCAYCVASHTAQAKSEGMDPEMHKELFALVAMANETNRLANAYQVPVDD